MSCSCSCSSKTLKIYKGFPTTFDNVPFLTVKTDSTIDIKGWKAKFIIDDVVKTYDSLQDGFSVSLTAEETETLKNGMRSASLVLIDAQGNERPVMTDIPCVVSNWVEGDVLIDDFTFTVSLKVDETTLELKLYGAQPDVAVTSVMDAKIEQHNTSSTAHADIRALIQDEATQRSDADNALSDRITSNYNQIDAINKELDTYGNIVTHNVNEFATASQGIKADTALQPQDLAPYRTAEAQNAIDATKQDVIPDLDTIREDATTGAGLKTQVETNTENIATINGKIPTQASATNQLADKDYVDNSVNNVSAFYITKNAAGDQFATKAELDSTTVFYSGGVVRVPTRNDYCIVASDETHNDARTRYTYQNGQWEFQYEVNERPFTSEEVAALESGITSDLVNQYSGHVASISNPHKVNKTQIGLGNVKNVDTTNAGNISSGTLSNDRLDVIPFAKLSGVASSAQGDKADTAVQPGAIADMATETWVKQQGYLTSTSLSGYATQEWVLGKGYITEAALLPYAKTSDVNTALSGKQDSLTTSQLTAVNSGITSDLVAQIGTNKTSIETLQTSKQDTITDLDTIRSGASKGATAVQPATLTKYRKATDQDTIDTEIRNSIPTNNKQLTNGAGYITSSALTGYAKDADVVKITGNQNVDGIKTFLDPMYSKLPYLDISITPTGTSRQSWVNAYDKNGTQVGFLRSEWNGTDLFSTVGTVRTVNNSTVFSGVQVGVSDTGSKYQTIDFPGDTGAKTNQIDTVSARNNAIKAYHDSTKQDIATAVNYDNITNCITEIPQDIKLSLKNGTLTLQSGSKVYVPNGSGVFDVVTIASDISVTKQTNNNCFVFYYNNSLHVWEISYATSGTTAPSGTGTWYDTKNNIIKRYISGSQTAQGLSFPLAIVNVDGTKITSIDQVFNGFGYIGSTVFALPGVKGLAPDGKNEDGSLKNGIRAIKKVSVRSFSGGNRTAVFAFVNNDLVFGNYVYDFQTNLNTENNAVRSNVIFGSGTFIDGKFTSFQPKTTFHAVDYSDFAATKDDIMALSASKQDTLVSGTNIKTVNGKSLLGGGNVVVVQEVSELPAVQDPNILYVIPVAE